jgi:hypothetical protein
MEMHYRLKWMVSVKLTISLQAALQAVRVPPQGYLQLRTKRVYCLVLLLAAVLAQFTEQTDLVVEE